MPNNQTIHIGTGEKSQKRAYGGILELRDKKGGILKKINDWVVEMSGVSLKERVTFFRLLATMINAGLSLTKSLSILEEQSANPKLKKICNTLKINVEMGHSLSEGLRHYPDVFESAQVGMIQSGEISGKLNQVLLQIADQIEKSAKVRGKIKGAMMYPLAIIIVLFAVVGAVTVMVIPNMRDMFLEGGVELPKSTQLLINLSDFLTGSMFFLPNWMMVIFGFIGLYFLIHMWTKTDDGKFYWNKFVFSIPVFGQLSRKVALSRFCRSLSTLLRSGISITKALQITSGVVGSEVYRRRVLMISYDVAQGITIAENIKGQETMWPIMLTSMIGVGEHTAQLDAVSDKLADFYEEEVDNVVKNLSSLMEPLIIVVLGVVVGFLVTAIMSPIMMMSEVATA